ncbi:crotonase/enoyl-CoA hydratase family protein [Variovorax rhizosphaerae]|uniref:Crotonase/enoyl-CoA hydratase family protein n=1 Tax=Variovorax rhizosphaerae TaxID=1836200 RepID=A0ABU8WGN2_9BURK
MKSYQTLTLAHDNGVLWLTLNRPDQLNAFTVQMARELIDVFGAINDDDAVRVVIVTGAGRAFCAGMDLTREGNVFGLDESLSPTLTDLEGDKFDAPAIVNGFRDLGGQVAMAILACRKPVIAAINGPAVGIGATMTLSMDIRIASDKARIGFVFGRVGIVPEACSTWLLPKLVGISKALEWLYRADVFDAEEGCEGGLIHSVVPADQLRAAAEKMARSFIDDKSAVSAALIRQMIYRSAGQPDPLLPHKIESLGMFHASQRDGKEGVAAFLERRPPQFKGKPSTDMPAFYPWW